MPPRTVQFVTTAGQFYEDTSFATGDSPLVIEVRDDLSNKPGQAGWFINDGAGDIQIAMQNNEQSGYGDNITTKSGEMYQLNGLNIRRFRITWVADSAYRFYIS